jgi:adenosine tuberculosinyltransferase
MDLETFQSLPVEEIAHLVRAAGPQVCVFPVNGTRRWFRLEHSNDPDLSLEHYVDVAARTYIRLFSMLYDHGIDTILSPAYGDELLTRGDEYTKATLANGLPVLEAPDFLAFYEQYDIRFRFYGSYRSVLDKPVYVHQLDLLDRISNRTSQNKQRRLFFGMFANDATEQVGKLAIDYYLKEKRYPNRNEIINLYYGEFIEMATMFIGFEKPTVFDYPLLGLGNESLYFTAAPSPYLTVPTFRKILYDHLFGRSIQDPHWDKLPDTDLKILRDYYQKEQETVLGTGTILQNVWISEQTGKKLTGKH